MSKPKRPSDTGYHVPPARREVLLGIRSLGDDLIEYAKRLVTDETKYEYAQRKEVSSVERWTSRLKDLARKILRR